MELSNLFDNLYEKLPKAVNFYTYNVKANVTSVREVYLHTNYSYTIRYSRKNKRSKTYEFKAYFVKTDKYSFFDFVDAFSTLNEREGDLYYISIPDVYLLETIKHNGSFTVIKGKEVDSFAFHKSYGSIKEYGLNYGTTNVPNVNHYIYSIPVKPEFLTYLVSALHYYNAIINGGNPKVAVLLPLIYWRMFEVNKISIVSLKAVLESAHLVIKYNPEELNQIIGILKQPDNEMLKLIESKAYNDETRAQIERLKEILEIRTTTKNKKRGKKNED